MRTKHYDFADFVTGATTAVMFVTGIAVAVFVLIAMQAFTLYVLWGWFVVPLGVPPLTIAWSAGIMLVASMVRGYSPRKSEEGDGARVIGQAIFGCGYALALGYVIKHYFM
jgi:hypothetical protein